MMEQTEIDIVVHTAKQPKKHIGAHVPIELHEKYLALGGSQWLIKALESADMESRVPKIPPQAPVSFKNDDPYLYHRHASLKSLASNNYRRRLCSEWEEDFVGFRKYVIDNIGQRPTEEHTLTVIDKDRLYEPGNLVWAFDVRTDMYDRIRNVLRGANKGLSTKEIAYIIFTEKGKSIEEVKNKEQYHTRQTLAFLHRLIECEEVIKVGKDGLNILWAINDRENRLANRQDVDLV